MADTLIAAHNCAFQTLALSTLGSDSVWDARLTAYLSAQALQRAETDFGKLSEATDINEREIDRAREIHGADWRSSPEACARVEVARIAANAAFEKWSSDLCEPYWQATRELVLTPAPTLAAALLKAQVIRLDEAWNDREIERDCVGIIAEDMARFTVSAPSSDGAILQAWEWRQVAYAQRDVLPDGADDTAYWKIIDNAEKTIREHVASTPQGAAIQLRIALSHAPDSEVDWDNVTRAGLEALADDADLDWSIRMGVAALRSLESMAPCAQPPSCPAPADDPVSRYWLAFHAHNDGVLGAQEYLSAFNAMHQWAPTTALDFVRKFECVYSLGGSPTEENQDRLIQQATVILGERSGQEA
jgi:hypothetical protein